MKRLLLASTSAVAVVLLVAGCSAGMSGSSAQYDGPQLSDSGGQAPEIGVERDVASETSAEQVIVTGSIWLTVEDASDAADDVTRVVESAGGHVDTRSEQAPRPDDPGRAEMTVRIPSTKLTATLDSLKEIGTVEESTMNRSNVTSTVRDLDARITALETSVDRLLGLMTEADTTADLITIESTLSERQADLESLQSQRRDLGDRVEYSTFTVYLYPEADAPAVEPDTFLSGLITGWEALLAFLASVLVVLGVLTPWLVPIAVILAIVLVIVRRKRRRKVNAAPSADVTHEESPAPTA